ncbi:MAG: rnhC [Chlamydiia bacterium]|nr:rnhC [Chlamydiia bacterium]
MSQKPNIFVTTINPDVIPILKKDLETQGFEFSQPPYTIFSAKKKGVSCTLYTSLKLTVQGKEMGSFIEFYLEPEILKELSYTYSEKKLPTVTPQSEIGRIGVDESGKGDFFGPLCIAAVFAEGKEIPRLTELGVKDSKNLNDPVILKLARIIQKDFQHSIIRIGPEKYNELYAKFGNLNSLLAWGHATAIENLSQTSHCTSVIIDQFAHEHVVINAIKRKGIEIELTQRHRGEEDVVVAAASILARAAFLDGLKKLELEAEMALPKGASKQVIDAGRKFIEKWGKEALVKVSKQHFKTTAQVLC